MKRISVPLDSDTLAAINRRAKSSLRAVGHEAAVMLREFVQSQSIDWSRVDGGKAKRGVQLRKGGAV